MVESKKFLTKNLKINAAVSFLFYALVYFVYYKLNVNLLSPSYWRVASVFVFFVGCFVSVMPAIARDKSEYIKLEGGRNTVYFVPLGIIAACVVGYIAVSFFHWSFSFEKEYLDNFCLFYLISTPLIGGLAIKAESDGGL